MNAKRIVRSKNICSIAAVALALLTIAAIYTLYQPSAVKWVMELNNPPMAMAMELLAWETQSQGGYPVAVRYDDQAAAQCRLVNTTTPSSEDGARFRSVLTLTEYIVSLRSKKVCVVIWEDARSAPADAHHFPTVQVQNSRYAKVFGSIQNGTQMYQTESRPYSLSNLDMAQPPKGTLTNEYILYRYLPRVFSAIRQDAGIVFRLHNANLHQNYVLELQKMILSGHLTMSVYIKYFAWFCFVGVLAMGVGVRKCYLEYSESMLLQHLPVSGFWRFMRTDNIERLQEQLLAVEREKMRLASEARERELKSHRVKPAPVVITRGSMLVPDAPVDKPQKIESMCNILMSQTPRKPGERRESKDVCDQARKLVQTDYEGARTLMTHAIAARRERNHQEKNRSVDISFPVIT